MSGGSRVVSVTPDRGTQETVTVNGVTIDVLHFRHFDQFGNDFSDVENYGFVVHLGGKRILHVGDVHYGVSNFEPFGLADVGIDVVILPTFNTLLSSMNGTGRSTSGRRAGCRRPPRSSRPLELVRY